MKFKFLILLLCTITIAGCSQQTDKSITPSSWIGKIKMGEANPELVFNIFKDSLGQLAGNLGIPSKGIKGIPLSKVYFKQDSIVLEISAAQASYKGIFEKNRKIINGIWTEPQFTSPLILVPLTQKISYDNFKKENTSSLNLEFTSENFKFYSKKEDAKVLESLSKALESNYSRLTRDMQTSLTLKLMFLFTQT